MLRTNRSVLPAALLACRYGLSGVRQEERSAGLEPGRRPAHDPVGGRGLAGQCAARIPAPQMVRAEWMNLNGLWDYAILPADDATPDKFDGQILVPFPVESALRGRQARGQREPPLVPAHLRTPKSWKGQRVLLHFGAVDWDPRSSSTARRSGDAHGRLRPVHLRHHRRLKTDGAAGNRRRGAGTRPTRARSRAASRC